MRKYPIDSPQARARIIAAALLADGGLDKSELDLLDYGAIVERLGIRRDIFDETLHAFCDDLNQYGMLGHDGQFDLNADTVAAMLDEVRSADHRKRLLCVMLEIVSADHRLDDGEASLVAQALDRWHAAPAEPTPGTRRAGRRWPPRVRRIGAEQRT
jgi:uncharacterized tellurite resistance protein B-like protein